MQLGGNPGQAISSGREGVQSVIDWLVANRADLPIGLAVAAAIVAVMLALRWVGARLVLGDPHCSRWRGVIGRVLQKTSIFFMVAAALDIVATYAAVPARLERLIARHMAFGRDLAAARERAFGSDERNAELIETTRARADVLVTG